MEALPHLPGGAAFGARLDNARRGQLRLAMPLLKDRAKTLVDLVERAKFIVAERPLALDAAAAALVDAQARALLAEVWEVLAALPDWSAAACEAAVKAFADRASIKLGAVAQPLRAVLTGSTASPGIFDVLAILGREESLARIGDQAAG
jgi:glutamyl-tRNA synthetase